MVKHFCDRCGKEMNHLWTNNTIYLTDGSGEEVFLEVCNECREEFKRWWNNA